jgi:hypothetical protein
MFHVPPTLGELYNCIIFKPSFKKCDGNQFVYDENNLNLVIYIWWEMPFRHIFFYQHLAKIRPHKVQYQVSKASETSVDLKCEL